MKRSDSIVEHVLFLNFVGNFAMQLLCPVLVGDGSVGASEQDLYMWTIPHRKSQFDASETL